MGPGYQEMSHKLRIFYILQENTVFFYFLKKILIKKYDILYIFIWVLGGGSEVSGLGWREVVRQESFSLSPARPGPGPGPG